MNFLQWGLTKGQDYLEKPCLLCPAPQPIVTKELQAIAKIKSSRDFAVRLGTANIF